MIELTPTQGVAAILVVLALAGLLAWAGAHQGRDAARIEDALDARSAPLFALLAVLAGLILRTVQIGPAVRASIASAITALAAVALARAVGMLAGRRRDRTATAGIVGLWFLIAYHAPIVPDPISIALELVAFLAMMTACARAIGYQKHHSELLVEWFWDALDSLSAALTRDDTKAAEAALARVDETLALVDGNPAQPTFADSSFAQPELDGEDLVLPLTTRPGKALTTDQAQKDMAQAFGATEGTFRYENLGETVAAGLGRFRVVLGRPWAFDMGDVPPLEEWPAGAVPLGRNPRGTVRYLHRHTATLGGETRAGKTTELLTVTACNLLRGEAQAAAGQRPTRVVIIDPKGDLRLFANHELVTYARTRDEIAWTLAALDHELDKRAGSHYEAGDPGWLIVIIDEAAAVQRMPRTTIAAHGIAVVPRDVIEALFSRGLSLGIQPILATQLTNKSSTGALVNGNAQVRIGFRVPKPEHARTIIDETVASRGFNLANRRLPQGRFLLVQPGEDETWVQGWKTPPTADLTRWKPSASVPSAPSASAAPHPLYTGQTPNGRPTDAPLPPPGGGGAWATVVPDVQLAGKHDRRALELIAEHGPVSLSSLAAMLPGTDPDDPTKTASKGTTSNTVDRLKRLRLVDELAEDGRRGLVLTDAGAAALDPGRAA